MVTKSNDLSRFYEFVAMETPIVLNKYIFVTTFFISIKTTFIQFFFVAMVTKLNNLS